MAVVNVQTSDDDYCFVWSVLAHLHPAQANPQSIQNYTMYASKLNLDGLTFPLPIKDIPRFERQNPDIAIHCMAVDSKDNSFSILYLSAHVYKRLHTITLLILDNERNPQKHHYVHVKNLSRLIAHRSKNTKRSHVCLSCLQVFSSERVLEKHERCCLVHSPQQVVFPEPDKCNLTFDSHRCEHPFDFYYVADFQSILKPHDDDNDSTLVNTHETAGFCLHRMTPHENYQTPPITYSESNAIEKFLEHIFPNRKKVTRLCPFNVP